MKSEYIKIVKGKITCTTDEYNKENDNRNKMFNAVIRHQREIDDFIRIFIGAKS